MSESIGRFDDWDRAEIGLVFCYEGDIPERGFGQSTAPFNSAWLLRSGWAEVTCGERDKVRGTVGQWIFLPPGPRFQAFSADASILSIAFRAAWSLQGQVFGENLPGVLDSERCPSLEKRAVHLLKQTTKGRKNLRFDTWGTQMNMPEYLKIKLGFLRWLESYAAASKLLKAEPKIWHAEDPLVEEVIRLLRSLAHRQELKTADLSERMGISVSQLNRRFTRSTGIALHRYYNTMRLEVARHRLRYGEESLKEIAYEMGFKHPSNFTNWFKAHTGISPRAYQKKA